MFKINGNLIKRKILSKYKYFIKKENNKITVDCINMFANEMNIYPRTVFNIINGKLSVPTLLKTMEILDIEPREIFIKVEE